MYEENKSLVRRYINEVWSKGNLDAVSDIIHPNAHPPHGFDDLPNGPEGFKHLVAAFRTSFPDLTRSIEDVVAEGDKVVVYYTLEGTHTGTGGVVPFPPTGGSLVVTGVTAFRIVDGKIFEETWAVNNATRMIERLGGSQA